MPHSPEQPTASIVPVQRARHAQRHWQRPPDYRLAARHALAPLASFEVVQAAVCLPLAFVEQAGQCVLAAVLGVPGTNLCVAPGGQWSGPYVPAVLRVAPFSLGQAEGGDLHLCIDEVAGQVAEGPGGEPFFTAEGQPAPLVQEVMRFLLRMDQGHKAMRQACNALRQQGVLVPWPVSFDSAAGARPVDGLLRVDEKALAALAPDALHALMQCGALRLAYSQLVSMPLLSRLSEWSKAHAAARATAPADLEAVRKMFEPGQPDTIQFNW